MTRGGQTWRCKGRAQQRRLALPSAYWRALDPERYAGVTTDICLAYPAISACREGYQVQAVMDASGSPYEISEEMSRRRMEREGVVLTATNTLMAELAQDWSRPEGGQLLGILFQDVLTSIA